MRAILPLDRVEPPVHCRVPDGVCHDGRVDLDVLRLDVNTRTGGEMPDEHEVRVFVNGEEQTARGAGLGMDPYDVIVPDNRLVAGPSPRTVPIARCSCGIYGCASTDVTITRLGDRVRWDWSKEAPMRRPAVFDAAAYDREVARFAADTTWEDAGRTAGRLVLTGADWPALGRQGLTPDFVGEDHRAPGVFLLALRYRSDRYQVFLREPWNAGTAEDLAARLLARLSTPPSDWDASWHSITTRVVDPPAVAGPTWRREDVR